MSTPDFKPSDAAPTYQRTLPEVKFGRAWLFAFVFFGITFAVWEMKWRRWGAEPTYRNSDGSWSRQRRALDAGAGDRTVLLGASRVLFDVQLHVWQQLLGERPLQLAIEGTTPLPMLEDLASNPKFTGRLLVGISPDVFFTGFGYREGVLDFYRKETVSQRAGQWLSMQLIEPFFAFYDDDFKLMTVLKRQPWPRRTGVPDFIDVRKLTLQDADRNTRMWSKVANDPSYRDLCREVWSQFFDVPIPGMETPAALARVRDEQIERTVAAVAKLRARGVVIVFLRPPSTGRYLDYEKRDFPRASTWDSLLAKTGAAGIHFEDYPTLQGYELPEWSHMTSAEAERFTANLCEILQRDHAWTPRSRPPQ